MSPALAGRLSTTQPPRRPYLTIFIVRYNIHVDPELELGWPPVHPSITAASTPKGSCCANTYHCVPVLPCSVTTFLEDRANPTGFNTVEPHGVEPCRTKHRVGVTGSYPDLLHFHHSIKFHLMSEPLFMDDGLPCFWVSLL